MYRSRSVFFKINGWPVKKGWCHVPIPLTQGPVPPWMGVPRLYVVQGRAVLTHKKDMCRLENPDDLIDWSPWVGTKGPFVLQVLFCQSTMEYYMPGINALGAVTVAAAALRLPLHPGAIGRGLALAAAGPSRLPLHRGARRRSLALAVAPWRSPPEPFALPLHPGARGCSLALAALSSEKAAVRSDGRVTACEQVTSNYKTGHCRLHFGGCPMKICPDLRAANSKGPHATH